MEGAVGIIRSVGFEIVRTSTPALDPFVFTRFASSFQSPHSFAFHRHSQSGPETEDLYSERGRLKDRSSPKGTLLDVYL